jgi:hypothetical protein
MPTSDPRRDRGTVRPGTVLTVALLVAVAVMIAIAAAAVLSSP